MSINNLVRTHNYKLTMAQLDAAKARINELESEVQKSAGAEEKASAFDLLAKKYLTTEVETLKAPVEISDSLDKPDNIVFDIENELKKVNAVVKSVELEPADDKYNVIVKLSKVQNIFNLETKKKIGSFDTLTIKDVEITPANEDEEDPNAVGDVTKYTATAPDDNITFKQLFLKNKDGKLSFGEVSDGKVFIVIGDVASEENANSVIISLDEEYGIAIVPVPEAVEEAEE